MVKGYLKSENFTDKGTLVTRNVDELVLGTYQPEIFVFLSKYSKNFGTKMPVNFSLVLEVSLLIELV